MSKRVLVTGGAGFIGSHAVEALVKRGDRVTVLDCKEKADTENLREVLNDIEYVEGDIRDREQVKKLVQEHTDILHLAAVVSVPLSFQKPQETHDVNVTGTLNVFEAAKNEGVERIVYASSAAVYGNAIAIPITEATPLKPLSPYGLHKCINELHAGMRMPKENTRTVGLRFFNVYGRRQDPRSPYSGVVSIFADKLKNGEPITVYGDGSATRDFVHVHDVVAASLLALDHRIAEGVFNVGSGEQTSINELLSALSKSLGKADTSTHEAQREGDILHSCAAIEKIRRELGYEPKMDLESGIKEMLM